MEFKGQPEHVPWLQGVYTHTHTPQQSVLRPPCEVLSPARSLAAGDCMQLKLPTARVDVTLTLADFRTYFRTAKLIFNCYQILLACGKNFFLQVLLIPNLQMH